MDDATRTQVILAAVGSAGPVGADKAEWNSLVRDQAVTIAVMLGENSSVSQALAKFANAGKPFPATILGGKKEASSTRVVVRFANKDGETEEIRTDRTDSPEGLAMSNIVRGLVGHKVLIWKELEDSGASGPAAKRYRVLRHIEDLGVDAAFAAARLASVG
jgi:hypothetical protein